MLPNIVERWPVDKASFIRPTFWLNVLVDIAPVLRFNRWNPEPRTEPCWPIYPPIPKTFSKYLAYVFTVLSGMASIALTIHKFGLSPWKKVTLIVGVALAGLAVVFMITKFLGSEKVFTEEEKKNLTRLVDAYGTDDVDVIEVDDDSSALIAPTTGGGPKNFSTTFYSVEPPEGKRKVIKQNVEGATIKLDGKEVPIVITELSELGSESPIFLIEYGDGENQLYPEEDKPFTVRIFRRDQS